MDATEARAAGYADMVGRTQGFLRMPLGVDDPAAKMAYLGGVIERLEDALGAARQDLAEACAAKDWADERAATEFYARLEAAA